MPSVEEVRAICLTALARAGVSEKHAATQVALLLDAELGGVASHGLLRLPRVIERIENGVTDPATTGQVDWVGTALAQVDGQGGLGPIVAMAALDQICDRALTTGVAAAAIRNCDHLGMLAWYAEKVAANGQVLLCFTISEALVHPWGGRRAMIGTNPIAIGVPGTPEPFVMDMATSLVSMGKVHDHANRNAPIPSGWALDANGDPTTVAADAKHGAIAPFGGAKGYALGLGFELLVASLTGSAIGPDVTGTLDSDTACNKGDVFIVLQPSDSAEALVSDYLEALRRSAPADPSAPVRIPGERARAARAKAAAQDIALDPSVWNRLVALAGEIPKPVQSAQS